MKRQIKKIKIDNKKFQEFLLELNNMPKMPESISLKEQTKPPGEFTKNLIKTTKDSILKSIVVKERQN